MSGRAREGPGWWLGRWRPAAAWAPGCGPREVSVWRACAAGAARRSPHTARPAVAASAGGSLRPTPRAWLLSMWAAAHRRASCAAPGSAGAAPASAAIKPWCCALCCSCAYPGSAHSGAPSPHAPAAAGARAEPACACCCRATIAASLRAAASLFKLAPLRDTMVTACCGPRRGCRTQAAAAHARAGSTWRAAPGAPRAARVGSTEAGRGRAPLAVQEEAEGEAVRKHVHARLRGGRAQAVRAGHRLRQLAAQRGPHLGERRRVVRPLACRGSGRSGPASTRAAAPQVRIGADAGRGALGMRGAVRPAPPRVARERSFERATERRAGGLAGRTGALQLDQQLQRLQAPRHGGAGGAPGRAARQRVRQRREGRRVAQRGGRGRDRQHAQRGPAQAAQLPRQLRQRRLRAPGSPWLESERVCSGALEEKQPQRSSGDRGGGRRGPHRRAAASWSAEAPRCTSAPSSSPAVPATAAPGRCRGSA